MIKKRKKLTKFVPHSELTEGFWFMWRNGEVECVQLETSAPSSGLRVLHCGETYPYPLTDYEPDAFISKIEMPAF